MNPIVVCDTSSLVKLQKSGILHSLPQIFEKLIIPQGVKDECRDKEIIKFLETSFVKVESVHSTLFQSLGSGEREAISLAVELNIKTVIIDDQKGWNKALKYGLEPISAITVILLAKDMKLISSVKDALDLMIANNEGITNKRYNKALKLANEKQNYSE